MESINPFTGKVGTRFEEMTRDQVESAIDLSHDAAHGINQLRRLFQKQLDQFGQKFLAAFQSFQNQFPAQFLVILRGIFHQQLLPLPHPR